MSNTNRHASDTEVAPNRIAKEIKVMCMSIKEMNETMEEIKSLKLYKEQIDEEIKALERKAIEFLEETEECQTTDKKGNPVLKFIGSSRKATYSWSSRETVDKEEVRKLLNEEEYQQVSKVSTFPVLRIS